MSDVKKLFKNNDLFDLAVTHKSWVNEHSGTRDNNERLEFLGDAVLEFIISEKLYTKFPDQKEGYLTALRASLVNTFNLSDVAKKINLGKYLYLSRGEEEGGGRENISILANTVEAIIGALFIDQGIKAAEKFIDEYIVTGIEDKIKHPLKDAKSLFQESVQAKGLSTPRYEVVGESGPDHDKNFVIEVKVNGKTMGKGEGKNKSEAAQDAAKNALDNLS